MAHFPFHDLHSFKDYISFVYICAPDNFPDRGDGVTPWTLELAFEGLRYGLDLTAKEVGEHPVLSQCRTLVDEAYRHYRDDHMREGFQKLESTEKLIRRIPSQ